MLLRFKIIYLFLFIVTCWSKYSVAGIRNGNQLEHILGLLNMQNELAPSELIILSDDPYNLVQVTLSKQFHTSYKQFRH